jgi:UDP-N-acetylbacillosamine N-acetyltransferase
VKKALVIYGCGGHGRSVAALAERAGYVDITFVDEAAATDERIMGYPVLKSAGDRLIDTECLAAFGDNEVRIRYLRDLVAADRRVVSVLAASSVISRHAVVEPGCFIGELSYVGPRARIGAATIVNTGSMVEHDCVIGAGCHISVGATIAGTCQVGDGVTIWAGATLRDGITVAPGVIVGAGAVVCENLQTPGTYVGVPARLKK